jgi:hypothetical protein
VRHLDAHGSKEYLMVRITTIDFPDVSGGATIGARRDHAMPLNVYALEKLVAARIAEDREAAARRALLRRLRAPGTLRARVGACLIRLGQWLTRPVPAEAPSHAR